MRPRSRAGSLLHATSLLTCVCCLVAAAYSWEPSPIEIVALPQASPAKSQLRTYSRRTRMTEKYGLFKVNNPSLVKQASFQEPTLLALQEDVLCAMFTSPRRKLLRSPRTWGLASTMPAAVRHKALQRFCASAARSLARFSLDPRTLRTLERSGPSQCSGASWDVAGR